jgi:hypothetical protein
MTFSQMHELLRLELLRRIQRGTLSVSLLSRQTGFTPSHLSNFLRKRRQLSFTAIDRILAAQQIGVADLMPADHNFESNPLEFDDSNVPLVSHASALFERFIRPTAVKATLHLPSSAIKCVRWRTSNARQTWQRFVAVRIPAADALPMAPLVLPGALAVIDRHYNSLAPYHPDRPTLYAVSHGAHLSLRYVDFLASRLVLRPHNIGFPVDVIEIEPGGSPNDLISGRVILILNET